MPYCRQFSMRFTPGYRCRPHHPLPPPGNAVRHVTVAVVRSSGIRRSVVFPFMAAAEAGAAGIAGAGTPALRRDVQRARGRIRGVHGDRLAVCRRDGDAAAGLNGPGHRITGRNDRVDLGRATR